LKVFWGLTFLMTVRSHLPGNSYNRIFS